MFSDMCFIKLRFVRCDEVWCEEEISIVKSVGNTEYEIPISVFTAEIPRDGSHV